MIHSGGGGQVTLPAEMSFLKREGLDTEIPGDVIHHHFDRKKGLRSAEPAIGSARNRVCPDCPAPHAKIGDVIDARCRNNPALEDNCRERRIGAGIEDHVNIHCCDPSVPNGYPVAAQRRMPFRGKCHILPSVIHTAYGLSAFSGGHRNLAAEDRRIIFFASESAAGHILKNVNVIRPASEHTLQRAVDIVDALG